MVWIINDATKAVQYVRLGSLAMMNARNTYMTEAEVQGALDAEQVTL
jgi:hypothetical protein